MLQFFDVTRDAPWFPQVKALYESAFPANERIPIKHLLDDKIKREFWTFFDGDLFCGFSNSITHGSITNIIYFAVMPELRSRGYGSQILQVIREQHPDTRIVVDIEVEEDSKDAEELERRNRRRDFYQRNGFNASPFDYIWQGEHYRERNFEERPWSEIPVRFYSGSSHNLFSISSIEGIVPSTFSG